MKNLSTELKDKYYYLKNGVVYDILSTKIDDCGKLGVSGDSPTADEVKIPHIKVKKGNETPYYLFLDPYIEAGDTYDSETKAFKKSSCGESDKTLGVFYNEECVREIKNQIRVNPTASYELFNDVKTMLGIPPYMISGNSYSITGSTQINFTEAKFDEYKGAVVEEEALKAANAKANEYNYKATSVTVEKLVGHITYDNVSYTIDNTSFTCKIGSNTYNAYYLKDGVEVRVTSVIELTKDSYVKIGNTKYVVEI